MKRDVCTCYENYFKIVPPMTFWSDTNSDLPIAKTNSVMFTINYPITKWVLRNFRLFGPADRKYFFKIEQVVTEFLSICLQTHHVGSTLKRRGNDRFYIVSTRNPRGVLVGLHLFMLNIIVWTTEGLFIYDVHKDTRREFTRSWTFRKWLWMVFWEREIFLLLWMSTSPTSKSFSLHQFKVFLTFFGF